MEYSLSMNLLVLRNWSLSLKEAFIASIIKKYSDPGNGLEHTDDGYVWINHKCLLNQFPVLQVSTRQLGRLLNSLVGKSVILKKILWSSKSGRKKAYYKMAKAYHEFERRFNDFHGASKTGINYSANADLPEIEIVPNSAECRKRIPAGMDGAGRFRSKA